MNPNVKKLAILAGGGPAPGINSVIGAATIRAALGGSEVIGIQDGFSWIMEGNVDHVMPLTIRDVSRIHFGAARSSASTAPTRPRKRAHLENSVTSLLRLNVDRLITIGGDDTAFSAYMLNEKQRRTDPGRARTQDDRQRPRPAARRQHLRLPDRAPQRRRNRARPDGRRQDHLALVPGGDDGPQGRPPRARHRQGRRRRPHPDPRGVQGHRAAAGDGGHHPRRDGQAPEHGRSARRRGARRGPGRGRSTRRTSPRSRASSGTPTDTSGSPRSTSRTSSRRSCSRACGGTTSAPRWWPRTSATSCAARTRSRWTWSTPATSASAPRSTSTRAAAGC